MQLKVTTCFVPNTLYLERDIDCRIDLIDQIKIQQIFFDHVDMKPSLWQIPTQLLQITQSKYLKGRSTNDDSANQRAHTSQVEPVVLTIMWSSVKISSSLFEENNNKKDFKKTFI